MSKYTKQWQPYKQDYDKELYDIKLADGKEYYSCWPNAGLLFPLVGGMDDSTDIPHVLVKEIRLTHHHPLEQ